jgi:8-oxo-dGTP pyrophosphatase MutT (NUDIX family)
VCLLRRGRDGIEVLMVQRSQGSRFMGGAWVFPGGAVDADDEGRSALVVSSDPDLAPWRAAAVRELVEETGIWLTTGGARVEPLPTAGDDVYAVAVRSGSIFNGDALVYFANWITPAPLPVRFDTRFFAFDAAAGIDPMIDGHELVDARWIAPRSAIALDTDGDWLVAFPTRKILEFLAGFGSPGALIDEVASLPSIPVIEPRIAVDRDSVQILLPSEAGFDDAGPSQADPDLLARILEVARSGGVVPSELRRA